MADPISQIGTVTTQGHFWRREAKLIVAKGATTELQTTADGLDLSELRFRFQTRGADTESPNTLVIRVYNLQQETVNAIVSEYNQVTLQAGYVSSTSANIFTGTIKQFKYGKESNTDTFLEITAAEADVGYNFGFVNKTLERGSSLADLVKACANALGVKVADGTIDLALTGGTMPRGKVAFGLARVQMRQIADSLASRWSVQNGVLVLIKNTGYLAGDVIILNPQTGLVGFPEATDQGVEVRSLLNPLLQIGQRVHIDDALIVQTKTLDHFRPDLPFAAKTSPDHIYRIVALDHSGDTRGEDWYSEIICLSLDVSSPPDSSVPVFPGAGQ
jgi:hypothetical protein